MYGSRCALYKYESKIHSPIIEENITVYEYPIKALEAEGRKIPKGVTIATMKKEMSKEALKYL